MIGLAGGVGLCQLNMTDDHIWQSQAVAHGAAEWVVDQKTGNTTFKWKEKK